MRRGQDANAVLAVTFLVVTVLVIAAITRVFSLPALSFPGSGNTGTYFRLRAFSVTYQAVALGALAYVVGSSRLSAIALRFAGLLGLIGVVAEVWEWLVEPTGSLGLGENDATGRSIVHVVEIISCGAVVLWWYLGERGRASGEQRAANLAG